eukprot:8819573-Alexandrium_andersonii.AAC.1
MVMVGAGCSTERSRLALSPRRVRGARCAEGAGQPAPPGPPLRLRTARPSWPTRAIWTGP